MQLNYALGLVKNHQMRYLKSKIALQKALDEYHQRPKNESRKLGLDKAEVAREASSAPGRHYTVAEASTRGCTSTIGEKAKAASTVYVLNWLFRCHDEADMSDFGYRNTNALL